MKLVVALLGLALLSGCTGYEYNYVPPPGAAGQNCIAACGGQERACQASENARYDDCSGAVMQDRRYYENCQQALATIQADCLPPRSCSPPDIKSCRKAYDDCWKSCGGAIVPRQEGL